MDEFDYALWSYRAVFTQANGGGGVIKVTITANERMLVLWLMTGDDDYAADRNVSALMLGIDGTNMGGLAISTPVDNERLTFPYDNDASAVPVNGVGQYEKRVLLGKGEAIVIQVATPIQNEVLTVICRALLRSWPPTVTTTGSGGTVTVAVTHDNMI